MAKWTALPVSTLATLAILCACTGGIESYPQHVTVPAAGQSGRASEGAHPASGGSPQQLDAGSSPALDAGFDTGTAGMPAITLAANCPFEIPALSGWTALALYHLDESGGAQVLDSSGNTYDGGKGLNMAPGGTINGGGRVDGACGRGVTLDGADSNLTLSPVGDGFGGGIAVELWLRPTSISTGEAHLIGDGGGGLASFQLVLVAGMPVFRVSGEYSGWFDLVRSTVAVQVGQWQHLRAVYDAFSGDSRIFIDGTEVARANRILTVPSSMNRIYVGAVISIATCCPLINEFVGDLDELVVWGK